MNLVYMYIYICFVQMGGGVLEGVYNYSDYGLEYTDADNLEQALGLDFTGVIQRELSAK